MKILITGSAGRLARVLIPKLLGLLEVDEIIGIDNRASLVEHPRLHNHLLDVRSKNLSKYFNGVDAAIHLAFIVIRPTSNHRRYNRSMTYDININGSINFFAAAALNGVQHIVYTSSSIIYGAWPNNPYMMNEQHHCRPIPGFSYSEDKVAIENWLDRFEQEQDMRIVRLRPSLIVGAHCNPFIKKILRQPFYPYFSKPPLLQCIWENDVADAVINAIFSNASGPFNLAATPPLSFRAMMNLVQRHPLPLPYFTLKSLQNLSWYITGYGDPNWFPGLKHSLTVDSSRAQDELAWQPTRSSVDCIREMFGIVDQIM